MRQKNWVIGSLVFLFVGVIFVSSRPSQAPGPVSPPTQATENQSETSVSATASDPYLGHLGSLITPPSAASSGTTNSGQPARAKQKLRTVVINDKEYIVQPYEAFAIPNDPRANQWWVTNTKLDQTWNIPTGPRQTTLAIIDTGFGFNHEDLENRWYQNPGESGIATTEAASQLNCTARGLAISASCNLVDENNDEIIDNEIGNTTYQNPSRLNCSAQSKPITKDCNRLDDDGNGYIDDVRGWDFINHDNSAQAGELNPTGSGTTHGTMVAGVAAATGNNGKGLSGVDWATKIMALQALDDDSYGDTLSVGRAIYYAAAQGADVISISLGGSEPDEFVREAIAVAIAKGIIVVAASGNTNCNCISYPANYPEVVAVGALETNNQPASFSSWGDNLDMLAPGTSISTSTWSSTNQTSAYALNVAGTSFATPMVSGMFTRLLSSQTSTTANQMIAGLTESTNRLSLPATQPLDSRHGFGTLDSLKVTNRLRQPLAMQQQNIFAPISSGAVLTPSSPKEKLPNGDLTFHDCPTGIVPTTQIYEIIRGGSRLFTASNVENQQAMINGYTSSRFAFVCVAQPQDTASIYRQIDMYSEFRNIYRLF